MMENSEFSLQSNNKTSLFTQFNTIIYFFSFSILVGIREFLLKSLTFVNYLQ